MTTTIIPGTKPITLGSQKYAAPPAGRGVALRGSTSGYVGLVAPATVTTPYKLTLPAALGATDKILQVDSSGNITFVDAPASASPAGSGTEIQYRNGSAFGAVTGSAWDATTLGLPKLSAISTTANQLSVGYDATYQATVNVSSAGVLTIAGYKPAGSNVAAGAAYLDVPVSTGNATPGSWIFRSTVATTSGSTAQTLADTLMVTNGRIRIINSVHSSLFGTIYADTQLIAISSDGGVSGLNVWYGGTAPNRVTIGSSGPDNDQGRLAIFAPGISGNTIGLGILNAYNVRNFVVYDSGRTGIGTVAPDRQVEINATDGNCLRLTYNDANGSATYYTDFSVSAAGNLTITPSGGIAYLTGNLEPATDDTYYIGKNDDDTPKAWKGVILADTTNGKRYRLEIISGVVTATDLTD